MLSQFPAPSNILGNTLQHTAHTGTHCNTLQQLPLSHSETLQQTATDCNGLQHTAKITIFLMLSPFPAPSNILVTHCNTLQHTATITSVPICNTAAHCNKLQHTATYCKNHHLSHALSISCAI